MLWLDFDTFIKILNGIVETFLFGEDLGTKDEYIVVFRVETYGFCKLSRGGGTTMMASSMLASLR
jgi:hypothetical protein